MAVSRLVADMPQIQHISGFARTDRRTKNLVKRLRPGDIAVISHDDLDSVAARALLAAQPAAVVNARPFITGKYPNRGPAVLAAGGIPLYQMDDPSHLGQMQDGDWLVIDESRCLYRENIPLDTLTLWDDSRIAEATQRGRDNLGEELEKFARNTLQYLDADKDLLLDPVDVPPVNGLRISGRHVLVVVRGEDYQEDLEQLRRYIRDVQPVIIAVDGGADAVLDIKCRPDVILGDMDSVSDNALRCGARLIVHAYARRDRQAPGLERVQRLGLDAEIFPVPGTSEDAALLFAYEHGADLIVAVGTHSNLEDFLDKGRSGMASTFLVRLKVGSRLVDARGVYKLYQPKIAVGMLVPVLLCALFPFIVIMKHSPILSNLWQTLQIWWRLRFH